MTSWIEDPAGGRARGPRGLARAWVEALVRPRRLFANGVAPGNQAPALTFAVAVAAAFTLGWLVADPSVVPGVVASVPVSALVVLLVVAALAAPVGLHLTAAVATVSVILASVELDGGLSLRDRGGVSETVQVVAYASSPMALAGPPVPALRVACGAYATALLLIGFRTVHRTTPLRTLVAGLPPALLGYGVGYRVIASVRALFG
ncbi:YIP1 family protein [Halorubrum sp. AD140]|uniref:YIP1 family protein n=1 Tax=Halorubrum sp. AD140 TaxID=3050073 RepID=UPI002ACCA215|nr:YIP1 family protein [Halorubrum sp. AD140]MDZ5810866.1 YIP1 family protein [Halorubrum sp. AD140]